MTTERRCGARIEDGLLYIEREGDPLEVGPMDAVIELIGGETYTIEYTDRQSAVPWLTTDRNNAITFDVNEKLTEWVYTDDVVTTLERCPIDETGTSGYSLRTEAFADTVTAIWDSKGNPQS